MKQSRSFKKIRKKVGSKINRREYVRAIQEAEIAFIKKALVKLNYSVTLTAHKLGINRATLYRKLAKYKLRIKKGLLQQ